MHSADIGAWSGNWAWSLPLIVLNVMIHVTGMAFVNENLGRVMRGAVRRWRLMPRFAFVMGITTSLATMLHGIEASIWAVAYRALNSLPDYKSTMLYSLTAMTSYGHANLFLGAQWQMMGALEALNGNASSWADHGLSVLDDPEDLTNSRVRAVYGND
jgi:hypothetical protein